ncbi:putative odorant receptor 71a [Monomorium pharaonis]|uniref:putative odorant receptor 71a n=1 Tax=Monomorium pharaonis TaxID=307658 RepID=UPI0017472DBD|nr:putative odorant receptor 71a [Monomorium pharaonis]
MLDKWMLKSDVEKKSETPVLKFTLTVLAVAGCWRPISWTSLFKYIIYDAYTALIILILYTFAITQVMGLILNPDSETFGDALFNSVISLLACYKAIILRRNHDSITILIDNLVEKPFKPIDLNESIIREKFDKRITNNTLCYLVLVFVTALYMIIISLFTDFKNGILMYKAWLPFDYSISVLFYFAYIHQILTLICIGLVHPTCDNLICGLLLHICCQIEILEYRLSNIANGQQNLRDCVRHHIRIYEYAYILNDTFSKIVPSEFAMIVIVMSYNLINMAFKSSSTASYIQDVMVVASTLFPIFYYCWFGNEIKLKSLQLSDSIYNIEWTIFNNNIKKGLLMIMNRATIPIEFTSADIISVNLDSFVKVLKTSYSLFNVLIRSQKIKYPLFNRRYARIVNRKFAKIIALQFAVSMLVVCANLYKLASISLTINGDLITLLMYTVCMLSQIFLYCWFGNELKLKSVGVTNSIYNMQWQMLDNKSKKDLLLLMKRSMVPIEFNSAVIITLNLDSFVSLLKASYSAYNLLKRSQEERN